MLCCKDLDFPVRRRRAWMVGVNKKEMLWTGPATAAQVQRDFEEKFFRTLQTHPRTLLVAEPDEIRAEYCDLAAKRGFELDATLLENPYQMSLELLSKIVAPGAVSRLQEWMDVKRDGGCGDWFVCDLDQHPRSHGGDMTQLQRCFPVLISHGTLLVDDCQQGRRRLLTSFEHLSLQGFDMHSQPPSLMRQIAEDLSIAQRKQLAGNGMHIPTMACWAFYILSHCIPRDLLRQHIPRSMSWEVNESQELEEPV